MSYIGNTAEELDSCQMINCSSDLDEIARKLRPHCLQGLSQVYIPKESKTKARLVDLLSGMAGVYKLVRLAGTSPVYLLCDHYDWESASGFYFVIGTHQEIKSQLLKLQEDRHNSKEHDRFW